MCRPYSASYSTGKHKECFYDTFGLLALNGFEFFDKCIEHSNKEGRFTAKSVGVDLGQTFRESSFVRLAAAGAPQLNFVSSERKCLLG